MDPFTVSHFSDRALLHDLKALVAEDRKTTAVLLTRIAEVEERKLYRQAGYDSMFACCLHELHFSEDAAYRHITAARVARRFPGVLVALAEGRLHMRAVLMLARHLTSGNADELVAAATHKTRAEIELLLAQRFPRPDLPQRLQAVPSPAVLALVATPSAPEPAGELAPERVEAMIPNLSVTQLKSQLAPERVEAEAPRPRVTPLAPERFGLQVTLDQETYDLLQQARALMSHQNPAGDIASVLKRALELLVGRLEKRKFAATTRPGKARRTASDRHIPAAVKRAVRERDGGRCTFVSESGRRCQAPALIEFEHENPVARGGDATVENVRLLCRAHNQLAAECAFGAAFMERKRAEARR